MEIQLKDDRVKRVKLDRVTLAIVDCRAYRPARRVLQHCINMCEFADAKLLTHFETEPQDPYLVSIPEITCIEEYSYFMVKRLADYVSTEFVLVAQADGFVMNPWAWTDEFYEYDYIGAPWHVHQLKPGADPSHLVGNGGFSLRSKRLCDFLRDDPTIKETHPEDVVICQKQRFYLEKHGFKFAPVELAYRFSCENYFWNGAFGQHAYFLLHPCR